MKSSKITTPRELAEASIIPSDIPAKEIGTADADFSAFRRERLARMTPQEQLLSRLLQLRYAMEDYIALGEPDSKLPFGFFLSEYLFALRQSNTAFSADISIHPTKLSRLLNNRDMPNEKLLIRLELHSKNFIPAITWYRVLEKQKESRLLEAKDLRRSEKKHVKALSGLGIN